METTVNKVNGNVTNPLKKHAIILFINRIIKIFAYYKVKLLSRSLRIEYRGAIRIPRVWIASALVPGTVIGCYKRLVERHIIWLTRFICSDRAISSGLPAGECPAFVNRHPAPA